MNKVLNVLKTLIYSNQFQYITYDAFDITNAAKHSASLFFLMKENEERFEAFIA